MPILQKNPDIILETAKKLTKPEMVISKDCAARIIARQIGHVNSNELSSMLEIYYSIVTHDNPAIRKTGAKHLKVPFCQYFRSFCRTLVLKTQRTIFQK